MPDEKNLDFEKIRWKMAEEMTPEDVSVLLENKDKLNEEELEAFDTILKEDTPLEDAINETVNNPVPEENTPLPDEAKPADEIPVLPENVITQDKLDNYLETKRKEWELEGKTKVEQTKEEEKIKFDLFKKDEIPSDWNDAVNKFAPALIEEAERRVLAKLEAKNKELVEQQAKFKQTEQEMFKQFEGEFATLAKNKLIPDPKEAPEAYKKIHDSIVAIGAKYDRTNITDSYKLWSTISEEHGGGLKLSPGKAKIEAQKEAASRISSGRGAPGNSKAGPPDWYKTHTTRMDDLIDQRLAQPF